MNLTTIRTLFNAKSTGGDLIVDDKWFCFTLEGIARADGVKVMGAGMTAIPAIEYKVKIHSSARFGRNMLALYTELGDDDTPIIRYQGQKWTHVYDHGGNWARQSNGCPLIAFNRISCNHIWKSAEKALYDLVSPRILDGEDVKWTVINDPSGAYDIPRPGSYA